MGEAQRLRDAGGIACCVERPAKDSQADTLHHGQVLV
jgi:hypothetical protein